MSHDIQTGRWGHMTFRQIASLSQRFCFNGGLFPTVCPMEKVIRQKTKWHPNWELNRGPLFISIRPSLHLANPILLLRKSLAGQLSGVCTCPGQCQECCRNGLLVHRVGTLLVHRVGTLLVHRVGTLLVHRVGTLLVHRVSTLLVHRVGTLMVDLFI